MEELTLEQLQARLAIAESGKAEAEAKASAYQAQAFAVEEQLDAVKAQAFAVEEQLDAVKVYADKVEKENDSLSTIVNAAKAEAKKSSPVEFETEDGDTFEFTCPTFTWDDNSVINVRELEAEAERDEKAAEKYATICANLVARESGIIRRKED